MNILIDLAAHEQQLNERLPTGWGGRWYGVFPAEVIDIKDPENQGRVKVTLPWAPDASGGRYEAWARLATLFGGNNRGSWFVPDVGDEVLVAFEHGDARRAYVLGGLWNGRDKAPESMDGAGSNNKKVLRSRNGVKITLDDQDGRENLVLETPGGQRVTLKDGPGAVEIVDSYGQLDQARAGRHHRHGSRQGHRQRQPDRGLGRSCHGQRRDVALFRRVAGRHRHQQLRHLGVLHAGRRQHLVK